MKARRCIRSLSLILLVALPSAGVPGCGLVDTQRYGFWGNGPLSDGYVTTLEKWNRTSEVPEELTLRLGLSAVLLSPEFRESLDQESRKLLGLAPDAPSPVLPPPVPGGVDVVVSVAGPTDRELALEAKQPFWNLLLLDSRSGRWKPTKITRIDDRSPERRLFPFHDTWSRLYLVTFPAEAPHDPGSGNLTLEATGVFGRTQVSWLL